MTDERWHDIIGRIKDTFPVTEEGRADLDDRPGYRDFIIFSGPGGKAMRVQRVVYPPVTGKTTSGSRRIGAEASVSYTYSETDTVQRMEVALWNVETEMWDEVKTDTTAFLG